VVFKKNTTRLMPQKILAVSDYFGNPTTTFIYNEVIGLSKEFEVSYLCTKRNNPEQFPFENLIEIPYQENRFIRKLKWWAEIYDFKLDFRNAAYSRKLNALVDDFKPDIIHCHFGYEALRFYQNFRRATHPKTPIIVSFRGHDASFHLERKSYVKEIKKMLSDPMVFPTFVCEFLRENVKRKGIQIDKHLILHSGTRTDFFKREKKDHPKEPFLFFQIAHFEERKGQLEAIKAFQRLLEKGRNAKLILGGGGPNLVLLKSYAEEQGLAKYIEFPGWLNRDQTKAYLEKSHAFVHHSITVKGNTEGIPNALMEAMSMELPVVSTFHAGIPELVENGKHGILVEERDIDAFATAMEQVMDWGYLQENRKRIEQEFSFPAHMENLINFYKQCLNG